MLSNRLRVGSSGPGCLHLPAPRQRCGGAGMAAGGSCLLQPLVGSGLYSKHGEEAELGSILGRCQITAQAVYYCVSLSWFLALVSQVLPLCGLFNKSLKSCPSSWQGHWDCAASLCVSQACSSSQAFLLLRLHKLFSNTLPACPPCPPCPQVTVPFGSPGAADEPVVYAGCRLGSGYCCLLCLLHSPAANT